LCVQTRKCTQTHTNVRTYRQTIAACCGAARLPHTQPRSRNEFAFRKKGTSDATHTSASFALLNTQNKKHAEQEKVA
jgi:hypothetical protein